MYAQDEVATTDSTSEVSSSTTTSNEKSTKAQQLQQNTLNLKQKLAERKARLEERSTTIQQKSETIKETIASENISEEKKKEITIKIETKAQKMIDRVDAKKENIEQKQVTISAL